MGEARRSCVAVDGDSGLLRLDGAPVASRRFEELRGLYHVLSGGEITATDEEFYAALFDDEVWILPMETPGLNDLLFGAWYEPLCGSRLYRRAQLDEIPRAWRRRLLGLLPLPVPRLGRYPVSTLPDWQLSEPLDFAELPRPGTKED